MKEKNKSEEKIDDFMKRRYMTQIFPWLIPIRQKQQKFFFYGKMRFDGNHYASKQSKELLPYMLFESSCIMVNPHTGFDMEYQKNKVFNLKLATKTLDKLFIRPGETFSFCERIRYADRETKYKDGLVELNGALTTQYGGGLCQISNLLCWVFLHSPLTILERHGHRKKDFKEPESDAPLGVDATIYEGWLDFKVQNNTEMTYQISIAFDDTHIIGRIYTEHNPGKMWKVVNKNLNYYQESGNTYEIVDVVQCVYDADSNELISESLAYQNQCQIGYPLPDGTNIRKKG